MNDIIAKVQALQVADDAALSEIVTALQALSAPSDPVVSIVVTTQSGATQTFVPQA